jgi:hypothetical protein
MSLSTDVCVTVLKRAAKSESITQQTVNRLTTVYSHRRSFPLRCSGNVIDVVSATIRILSLFPARRQWLERSRGIHDLSTKDTQMRMDLSPTAEPQ